MSVPCKLLIIAGENPLLMVVTVISFFSHSDDGLVCLENVNGIIPFLLVQIIHIS